MLVTQSDDTFKFIYYKRRIKEDYGFMVQGKLKTSSFFFTDTLNILKATINSFYMDSTEDETRFPYVLVHISYLQITLLESMYFPDNVISLGSCFSWVLALGSMNALGKESSRL